MINLKKTYSWFPTRMKRPHISLIFYWWFQLCYHRNCKLCHGNTDRTLRSSLGKNECSRMIQINPGHKTLHIALFPRSTYQTGYGLSAAMKKFRQIGTLFDLPIPNVVATIESSCHRGEWWADNSNGQCLFSSIRNNTWIAITDLGCMYQRKALRKN